MQRYNEIFPLLLTQRRLNLAYFLDKKRELSLVMDRHVSWKSYITCVYLLSSYLLLYVD